MFPQLFFERQIPVVRSEEGIRAVSKGEAIKPESVEHYLQSKFGEALPEVPCYGATGKVSCSERTE